MANLPFDYARCAGTSYTICQTCLRRTPGRPEMQVHIAPDPKDDQTCMEHISPEYWNDPNR